MCMYLSRRIRLNAYTYVVVKKEVSIVIIIVIIITLLLIASMPQLGC